MFDALSLVGCCSYCGDPGPLKTALVRELQLIVFCPTDVCFYS